MSSHGTPLSTKSFASLVSQLVLNAPHRLPVEMVSYWRNNGAELKQLLAKCLQNPKILEEPDSFEYWNEFTYQIDARRMLINPHPYFSDSQFAVTDEFRSLLKIAGSYGSSNKYRLLGTTLRSRNVTDLQILYKFGKAAACDGLSQGFYLLAGICHFQLTASQEIRESFAGKCVKLYARNDRNMCKLIIQVSDTGDSISLDAEVAGEKLNGEDDCILLLQPTSYTDLVCI